MRAEKSIKNFKYNILAQILNLLVQFGSRTVFIHVLGKSYLGVSGLFSNILTILSLADLGIGTVLVYSMYDPLCRYVYSCTIYCFVLQRYNINSCNTSY